MTEKREYELVHYDCEDGECLMIHEKTRDSKLGALSLNHRSIGEAIVEELNDLSEKLYSQEYLNNLVDENEQLRQRKQLFHNKWYALRKENKQLKEQLQNIKELFDNTIRRNEEAIEWGKSTGADYGAVSFHNEMLKKMKRDIE